MQSKRFVGTLNNYTNQMYENFKRWSLDNCAYIVIGKEVGQQGTHHLQWFMILNKNTRYPKLHKVFLNTIGKSSHIEKAGGSNDQAADYCKKDGVFYENGAYPKGKGTRTDIIEYKDAIKNGADDEELADNHTACYFKYNKSKNELRRSMKRKRSRKALEDEYDRAKLRPWQKIVLRKLKKQTNRKVTWVFDQEGNMGKSWLANYLAAKENAFIVEGGKRGDIAYAYDYEPIVIFDFTRSQEEHINYSVIESFKNGRIFNPKYESGLKVFTPAKVLCLSNFYPDRSKLSEDRWEILENFAERDTADLGEQSGEPPKKRRRLNSGIGVASCDNLKPGLVRHNVVVDQECFRGVCNGPCMCPRWDN